MWVVGIWTQVLGLLRLAIYQLSHLLRPYYGFCWWCLCFTFLEFCYLRGSVTCLIPSNQLTSINCYYCNNSMGKITLKISLKFAQSCFCRRGSCTWFRIVCCPWIRCEMGRGGLLVRCAWQLFFPTWCCPTHVLETGLSMSVRMSVCVSVSRLCEHCVYICMHVRKCAVHVCIHVWVYVSWKAGVFCCCADFPVRITWNIKPSGGRLAVAIVIVIK